MIDQDIINLLKQIGFKIDQINCNLDEVEFGITTLDPPVDEPTGNDPVVLFNVTSGIIYYWDGDSWEAFAAGENNVFETTVLSPPVAAPTGTDPVVLLNVSTGVLYYWDGGTWQTFSLSFPISDAAYGVGWDGDTTNAASKNAIYDKIESVISSIPTDTNLSTTNLTFSANRQHDLVGKTLKFVGQVGASYDIEITGPSGTHYMHIDEDDVTLKAVQTAGTQFTILDINVLDATLEARNNSLRHGLEVLPTYARLMSGASGADGEVRIAAASIYLYNALGVYVFANSSGTLGLPSASDSTPDYGLGVNSADGRIYRISKPVSDAVYGAGWDGVTAVAPSKNAVYDKIEALAATIPTVSDTAYAGSWDGVTTVAPSKNAVYDQMQLKANTTDLDNIKKDHVGVTIDGGGSVITTGQKGMTRIPYSGTFTGWTILETSDTPISGSIVVDIWKDTYANFPPTVADSILTNKPTLSSATNNQNLSPTFVGAGATVTAGDIIAFNVEATPSSVKRVTVLLHITKS